jgi:hypothetical protein
MPSVPAGFPTTGIVTVTAGVYGFACITVASGPAHCMRLDSTDFGGLAAGTVAAVKAAGPVWVDVAASSDGVCGRTAAGAVTCYGPSPGANNVPAGLGLAWGIGMSQNAAVRGAP